ncbi:hypothetical protein J8273_8466 [Carpediemonas membranifera]|uniref:Uncharacterized protein n=1 Tax=Carpediemonas membranifera TaxID=201153 RepID=A0A8J6APQ9_9EUKA|nr:hypothetical protein J8273_8466 [Carpediemonas membranifera]|eukprot:KAG9389788.1 hypothetical protein J8273_8466 [Carpediemonas membranifera]
MSSTLLLGSIVKSRAEACRSMHPITPRRPLSQIAVKSSSNAKCAQPEEPVAPALGTDDWAGLRTDTTVAMADVTKRIEDTLDHEKLYRQQKELMATTAEFGEAIERMEDSAVRLVLQNNRLLFKFDPQLESRMKEMRRKYCS